MDQEIESTSKKQISLSYDDFEISAESFRPVTKGLGFHHEVKKTSFRPVLPPKLEQTRPAKMLSNISNETDMRIKSQTPTGLEAFYNMSLASEIAQQDSTIITKNNTLENSDNFHEASTLVQGLAWITDLILISSLVIVTGICLVLVSGMEYGLLLKLVPKVDLIIFSSSLFSIYYILYFTILDLTSSPGKTLFGIHLVGTDKAVFTIKNTFVRSLVSLLSILVFGLPLILDFQGRLSDTKLVK